MENRKIRAEQKLMILLEGMSGKVVIPGMCYLEGVHPRQFYQVKKHLFSGHAVCLKQRA